VSLDHVGRYANLTLDDDELRALRDLLTRQPNSFPLSPKRRAY
jgi:hypothetical protein